MANGLSIEKTLVAFLEHAGFRLAPPSDELDRLYKVDTLLLGPPHPERKVPCFFPAPIGVQITTRVADWPKRGEFYEKAQAVAPRLAYVELPGSEFTPELGHATVCALTTLFFEQYAPQRALIRVRPNAYERRDLQYLLQTYRTWLATPLPGELQGAIVRWDQEKKFGFINATVLGPEGIASEVVFFFHLSHITDEQLVSQLTPSPSGDLFVPNIPVIFVDGGQPTTEHWRKTAFQVRHAV